MGLPAHKLSAQPLIPSGEINSGWYVRLTVVDRPGFMSDITQVFTDRGISIESLVQKAPEAGLSEVSIVLLTHLAAESVITDAIEEITAFDEVRTQFTLLRVETFE